MVDHEKEIRTDAERNHKLVIVGEKNIGPSFMAESILYQTLLRRKVENIDVQSRGLIVLFEEPVSPIAASVLLDHGYPIRKTRSSQFTEADLDADLILTMTPEIQEQLKNTFESVSSCMYVGTFVEVFAELSTEPPVVEETEESYENLVGIMEPLIETVADRLITEVFPS